MKTIVKFMLIAVLAIGMASCGPKPGLLVDAQGPMTVAEVVAAPNTTVIKEKVLFDFDSYKLDAVAESTVEKVAGLMKEHPDTLLILKGHTDKHGADDYNQTLSENRANAVKDSLVDEGVAADRITEVKGFGKTQLIPNLSNRENRRVLIISIGE